MVFCCDPGVFGRLLNVCGVLAEYAGVGGKSPFIGSSLPPSNASLVEKKLTVGFCNDTSWSQCGASSKQQYLPCSSHRQSTVRFSPFFGLCGHADLATTHSHPFPGPYLQVQELDGLPGRLTVQKILLRQTGMPQEVVRWPRIHDMHAILHCLPVCASITSIVLKGFSCSMMAEGDMKRRVVCYFEKRGVR